MFGIASVEANSGLLRDTSDSYTGHSSSNPAGRSSSDGVIGELDQMSNEGKP